MKLFFDFFYKMTAGAHFRCPKFTFDRISGHFRSIGHFGCAKFTFDRKSGHFCSDRYRIFFFGGHFGCPKFTFDGISSNFRYIRNIIFYFWQTHFCPFQINTQLSSFLNFFLTKWPPAAILDGTTMSIIELVRDIWMSNACVKFEESSLNPSKVIALTTKLGI